MDDYPIAGNRDRVRRILERVQRLLELEAESHPATTDPAGKTARSTEAMFHIRVLVNELAGWAINHAIGVAVSGDDVNNDDHYLEGIGATFDPATDAAGGLRALQTLIHLNPGSYPKSLRAPLIASLAAARYSPELSPFHDHGHNKHYNAMCRVLAAEIVYYRYGRDGNLDRAKEEVGAKIGRAAETIKDWLKQARDDAEKLGFPYDPDTLRRQGREAASIARKAEITQAEALKLRSLEQKFGEAALEVINKILSESGNKTK